MMRVGPADNVWHSPSMSKPIQLCLKKASVIAPFMPRRTQSEVAGIVLGCNHSFYCVLLPSMPKVPAKNLKAVKANSGEFNSQKRALRKHGLKFPKRGESQATSLEDTWLSRWSSLTTGFQVRPELFEYLDRSHRSSQCVDVGGQAFSRRMLLRLVWCTSLSSAPITSVALKPPRHYQAGELSQAKLSASAQSQHVHWVCYTPLHLTTSFSSGHGQNLPQSAAATSQPSQLPFYNHQGESSAGGCDRLLDWLCGQKQVASSSLAPNCSDNTPPETKLACTSLKGLRHQAPHNSTNPFQAVSWLRNQTANKAAWKSLGDVSPREDMPGFPDPSTLFPKMDHCLFQFGAWHLLGLLNRNQCSCYLLMPHIDGEAASRQGFLRLRHSPNGRDVIQIITILILGP